jgi:hypothetical protein
VYSWRHPESYRVESGTVESQTRQAKGQNEGALPGLACSFLLKVCDIGVASLLMAAGFDTVDGECGPAVGAFVNLLRI